ncbi:MAG: SDR family NAD(P)-dependent oxidoreductase [Burkholderiaceae bacterium]|nr:SDR family NAD(P)-dependent oxidoreductase [Burkholderiaceae bacterium]
MRFAGKTALVTGAGGPMGGAVAERLAAEGVRLVLTDISANRLNAVVSKIGAAHPQASVLAHRCSVLAEADVNALMAAAAAAQFECIDVLINIVGGIRGELTAPVLTMTEERWDSTFEFNLKGIFHLVRRVGPGMLERQYGRIVNISSVTYAGDAFQPEYGAAKAAVASITRSLALELAPHVTVNCVAPGLIETSVLERVDERFMQSYRDRTPLRRFGRPEEIAAAVAFLASDDASYVTGAILPVSGGIWPAL